MTRNAWHKSVIDKSLRARMHLCHDHRTWAHPLLVCRDDARIGGQAAARATDALIDRKQQSHMFRAGET